jgi:hypothetical protein
MITNLHINNIEVSGRLGNNLFQIALLIGLKEKYGSNYFIPTWRHSKDFPNVLCNEKISLKPNKFYNEPKYCHNEIPSTENLEGDLMDFKGYFQSYKYFSHCRESILEAFKFTEEVYNKSWLFFEKNKLDTKNLCVVHIRRTDYLQKQNFHSNLLDRTSYYIDAIKEMKKDVNKFLVFSDDIEFCKRIFGSSEGFYFSDSYNEVEDLCLMSLCRNFIIANSSFSWWGAYLSKDPKKTVIAPKRWFEVSSIDTHDLIPKEWKLI